MANGHVKISDHNGGSGCDPESTSDSAGMEDSVEFRLMMAFAKRRRPQREPPSRDGPLLLCGGSDASESSSLQTPEMVVEEELKETAKRLTEIADEIPFLPPDIETDSSEDADENVEKLIGLLLRGAGDRLNEAELQNTAISSELFWNYSFFKLLLSTLLERMGLRSLHPDSPGPKASPKTQIAVTCEVTTRLAALSSLPRNRLLGHGARYLQHYYSSWVQEQGGYVEAFYSDNEEDEDQ